MLTLVKLLTVLAACGIAYTTAERQHRREARIPVPVKRR